MLIYLLHINIGSPGSFSNAFCMKKMFFQAFQKPVHASLCHILGLTPECLPLPTSPERQRLIIIGVDFCLQVGIFGLDVIYDFSNHFKKLIFCWVSKKVPRVYVQGYNKVFVTQVCLHGVAMSCDTFARVPQGWMGRPVLDL